MIQWIKKELDPALVRQIAQRFGIDMLTATILARRGIVEANDVKFFLEDDLQFLHNPFLFHAMEDALDRLIMAREEEEKVLVFGDSDADGVTSSALLLTALRDFGLDVSCRVPEGEESYGLSMAAIDEAARQGISLIITVDCGISNHREVEYARSAGIDVIITDHHHLQAPEPPAALAVIDPKLPECGYPFRDLAGCGVALKVAHALAFARLNLFRQPYALLHIYQSEAEGNGTSSVTVLEALRIENLLEQGRLVINSDRDGLMPPDSLERLERFLRNCIVIVWKQRPFMASFRSLFGSRADLTALDLSEMIATRWPQHAQATLESLASASKLQRYSQTMITPAAAMHALFSAYVLHTMLDQNLLTSQMLQFAALGTIADLMPLRDENRIIVRQGVQSISDKPSMGLWALKVEANLIRPLGAQDLAWQITPLLNAAGRLGKASLALNLLLEQDASTAQNAARMLIQTNQERRTLGSEAWTAIQQEVFESFEKSGSKYAIVASPLIKSGITGLLASLAANSIKAPAIIAAIREDGTIVGSIRAGSGFQVTGLLAACSDLFLDYGGHDAAAGFTMPANRWEEFATRVNAYMRTITISEQVQAFSIDAELPHPYVTPQLIEICRRFEPYGEEHEPLVFCSRDVPLLDAQIIGRTERTHLKLTLDFGSCKWPAIMWGGAERLERDFSFLRKDKVDVLYKVTMNYWNGEERPQLEIYDIRRAHADGECAEGT